MGMQGIIPPNINYNKNISDGYQIRPYTAGETCIHNNTLYKAKQDITVAEEWNPEHWEETTVEQELSAVNTNIADITPDDAIVGGKPWTSKHIVDMLCPPLEVSGNPVQCYPVPGYPLGITASWEPVQEGNGDPSPDNIRPIKGRNSVTVMRYPTNILKNTAVSGEKVGVTVTVNDDGSILLNGTSGSNFSAFGIDLATITFVKGITYTISGVTGYTSKSLQLFTESSYAFPLGNRLACSEKPTTATAQKTEKCKVRLYLYPNITYDNVMVYPMIIIGGNKKEPYSPNTIGSAEFLLALPDIIYGGSVDAVTGEGQKEWNIINLNDSIYVFKEQGYYVLNIPTLGGVSVEKPDTSLACCSHYPPSTKAVNGYGFYMRYGGNGFVIFDSRFSTPEELKAYFAEQYAAETPVQIAYKLNAPTSFSATGNEPVKALSGVNTVLTDADSAEVTGRVDLPHAIAGQ